MREFSKDLKNTIICSNDQNKRCRTVNTKRKNSESNPQSEDFVIGKYKYFTDTLLGEGYSSKVYKGTQLNKPHKRYAIKVIELRKFQEETLKMLEQQINIHLNLKHPNIVECFDAIKTKNHYYLILEFCPHGSLQEFIRRKKKIALSQACEIMEQISQGYKYLLSNKIVHRDIKPDNILKHENTWKIADFGFAVRKSILFTSHMNVGTPLYMPPQALVRSQYSFKSDIFALGVTFYQMIHGETPWTSRTEQDLIQKMKVQPLFISNYINNEDVKNFIKKACAVEFKERLSHQEFEKIKFLNFVASSQNTPKQKIIFRAVSPRKNSFQSTLSSNAFAQSKDVSKDPIKQSKISQNQIMAQVSISKHIYSMIANIESFLLDQKAKEFFWMSLFKFLVRFIHQVQKKSESIKASNKNLYNQIKELALRYEKQYLDYLKHLQVKVIREVNSRFSELCTKDPFSKSLYKKTQDYLFEVLKQVDKQLLKIVKGKQKIDLKDKIQAFRALKKLYEHCSDNCSAQNSSCTKKLQVCENYKAMEKNNEQEFYNLRKVLINF